ncbi:MAG TPA: hypothetical protein VNJ54_20490 [Plantibacter sp.]|uniref:hypothetical protein n=1 Tax=Plantibacter sp. RU18 TaxID=3158143 RepID=UPI002B68ADE6|nr:hypothetical protein [Plantibacter sp.]
MAARSLGSTLLRKGTVLINVDYRKQIVSEFPDRTPELVDGQIAEVLKYLTILSEGSKARFIPLTREADEIWHEMIVQTQLYFELCAALPGGRYIHHESIGMDGVAERIGRREAVTQFVEWIPDYTSRFGPFTEATASHWAVVQFLREEVGLSLDEVNALSSPVSV